MESFWAALYKEGFPLERVKGTRPATPALLEAQKKLHQLQRERRRERLAAPSSLPPLSASSTSPGSSLAALPAHLGWESGPFTALLRREAVSPEKEERPPAASPAVYQEETTAGPPPPKSAASRPALSHERLTLYPDLALALLKEELAGPGRVWLLLRLLDKEGQGQLSLDAARRALTEPDGALRICGRRQLRNLLNQGEEIFWRRRNGRIWLRSAAKAAVSLGVTRLTGRPVSLPASALLQGIGETRAHLYASFHSGRVSSNGSSGRPEKAAKPISRSRLEAISQVSRRSQRNYEQRAGVRRRYNFAIGEKASPAARQERGWRQGPALFEFTDKKGLHGKAGATYLAWQLPNHYAGPHEQKGKGAQKRLNRQIADLLAKGITGNGSAAVGPAMGRRKRFYHDGALAAKAYNRQPDEELYWTTPAKKAGQRQVWYLLSAGKERG